MRQPGTRFLFIFRLFRRGRRRYMSICKFQLGGIVATPGALSALEEAGQDAIEFVSRHACGDWGELSDADKQENEFSLLHGFRLLSAYTLRNGTRIWAICEVGNAPQWLTYQIDPASERLFAVDAPNAVVDVFAIDTSSGALTQLPGTSTEPSIGEFFSSAMDPAGRFLYVGAANSFFTGFSLTANTASGTLPLLPGMPVQASTTPNLSLGSNTMAIDSSGTYLFSDDSVCITEYFCGGADALVEFQIDPTTNALTQVPSSPVTLLGTATRIVVAPPQ